MENARAFAKQGKFEFPLLFASDEVAGIYNIIYRYLFDRRRDMPIPTAFLLDRQGMIVKVYQGLMNLEHLQADLKSVPTTAASRMEKALPFKGLLAQDAFQRNDFTYGVAMYQHREHFWVIPVVQRVGLRSCKTCYYRVYRFKVRRVGREEDVDRPPGV